MPTAPSDISKCNYINMPSLQSLKLKQMAVSKPPYEQTLLNDI